MSTIRKAVVPSDVQEMQVWMPSGEQGDGNLPTLQEFIDSAIRQDGALQGSITDVLSFNKVLSQLSRMVVGMALYINSQGKAVRDSDTPANIRDSLLDALKTHIQEVIDPTDGSAGVKRDITYEPTKITLVQATPAGSPLLVAQYDVGRMAMLAFLDGVYVDKGTSKDAPGTPSWYEVGELNTTSTIVKFNCDLPAGITLTFIRLGDLRFIV